MTPRHELSGRQMRALLLLLVILPLSPTVWMFRFMVEAVRTERAATDAQLAEVYGQALASAGTSLRNHPEASGTAGHVTAGDVLRFYRRELDPAVRIQIVDTRGRFLTGDAEAPVKPLAEAPIGMMLPGARVRLFAATPSAVALVDEQIDTYGWSIALVVMVTLLVSGAAAITLLRQSRLRELQSSALATVAHELKTPLASMRVLTDTLLAMAAPDPERCRGYLQLIAAENERLIRLTQNFLTLSRFEAGSELPHRSPVEPAALVEAALKSLELRFREAGVQPETTVASDLPTVTVDRESIAVVLVNLLDNALKYSEPGQPVALTVETSGNAVEFVVKDRGIGIDAEALPMIFDRFFQVDQKLARTREGCGLGLHIARSIVEAHGGTVTVRSAPGSGSTFCVSLPATNVA